MRTLYGWVLFGTVAWACSLSGCGGGETPSGEDQAVAETGGEGQSEAKTASALEQFPQVVLETTHGRITIELDAQHAPATVQNFLDYVDSGHYNGTLFHQLDKGYVLLGGGYAQDLTPKPTQRPIRNEAENGLKNEKGTIAMARTPDSIHSATCQFFVNLADNPQLDHKELSNEGYGYCVFGRVIEGWDAIEAISETPVSESDEFPALPAETVMIRSAKRIR